MKYWQSYWRGNAIFLHHGEWFYTDTGALVSGEDRECGFWQKPADKNGHDSCLGVLPGVMNACCGHGNISEAYVQFNEDNCIRGKEAILVIENLRKSR